MDTPACQVITNAEALAVVQLSSKRLKSASCTMARDRRTEVRWTVSKTARYLAGAADVATAARVSDALAALGVEPQARVMLINAKADTEIGAFLAAPECLVDSAVLAEAVEKAWRAPAPAE